MVNVRLPPSPLMSMSTGTHKVSAIGLWKKHSFARHLSANFEIREAGSGHWKDQRHRDKCLFHRHWYDPIPYHFMLSCRLILCNIMSCYAARCGVRGTGSLVGWRIGSRTKEVWGSNPSLGGLWVSPFQVSGGVSTLQWTTQGIPSGSKRLLRGKRYVNITNK